MRGAFFDRLRGGRSAPPAEAEPAPRPKPKAKPRPTAASKPKPGPKPASQAKPKPKAKARSRSPRSRTRKPPPPLLQRRSPGPMLARAAVLAVAVVCMVAFAVALARVTLVPSPASDSLTHTNLRPGASIRTYLDQPDVHDTVKQIGGNVALGVPFGILLPTLFPRVRGFLRVALLTALTMVLVETAQGAMVEGRAFDVDDVILNTVGALLGYLLLGHRLAAALHPDLPHWWHRYFPRPANRKPKPRPRPKPGSGPGSEPGKP